MSEHETVDLRPLAAESKSAFAAGDFKTATRLFLKIKELQQGRRYIQGGDGTILCVELNDDGSEKTHPRTGEFITVEVK
jgi:hypothetical protein